MEKNRAASYARVSNPSEQREASIESQEAANVALLEAEGYEVPLEYRFRERFTGMESIYDRPVLARIRELAESGAIKAVASYDTDRLCRDPDELAIVVRGFHKAEVKPLFVKMDMETQSRIGKMVLYLKGFASALEYDAIRDRTMRGRAKITQAGQFVGSGPVKYGYTWSKATRSRQAHEERAPIVRRIFEAIASGVSSYRLAALLNAESVPPPAATHWNPSTLRAMIRDRTYIGQVVVRKTMPGNGRHPCGKRRQEARPPEQQLVLGNPRTEPLVTTELFGRANAALELGRHERTGATHSQRHLLAGRIWCLECGGRMTPQAGWSVVRGFKYRNYSYRCYGGCGLSLGTRWVDALAWQRTMGLVTEPGFFEREIERRLRTAPVANIARDIAVAERRRKKCQLDVKRLLDCQLATESRLMQEAVKEKLECLDREAESLDRQLQVMRARLTASRDISILEEHKQLAAVLREKGVSASAFEEKRKIIEALRLGFKAGKPAGCRTVSLLIISKGSTARSSLVYAMQLGS